MRLTCDFDNLVTNLKDLSEVVEDRLLSEDLKNVTFRLSQDKVELVGINQIIVFTRKLSNEYFSLELTDEELAKGTVYFQLRSKELLDFLSSYQGVRKTKVEEVSFEFLTEAKVKCMVLERDMDTNAPLISSWVFNNIMLKPNVLNQMNKPEPEGELETVETLSLMFYTRNLFPLMQPGTNLFSKLTFGDDYVVAFCVQHYTFMKNLLGDTFKGIVLTYRAVSFMDKVVCNEPQVQVTRTDMDLFFKTENSTAFIRYDNKLPEYKAYINMFNRDHAICLDRVYLKDILKRLRLLKDTIVFTIKDEEGVVNLKNTKFEQSVPMLKSKALEEIEKKSFKILPNALSNAIIGSDDEFSSELFIYYCMQPNNTAVIIFTDNSGSWFSTVSVKPF